MEKIILPLSKPVDGCDEIVIPPIKAKDAIPLIDAIDDGERFLKGVSKIALLCGEPLGDRYEEMLGPDVVALIEAAEEALGANVVPVTEERGSGVIYTLLDPIAIKARDETGEREAGMITMLEFMPKTYREMKDLYMAQTLEERIRALFMTLAEPIVEGDVDMTVARTLVLEGMTARDLMGIVQAVVPVFFGDSRRWRKAPDG